MDEKKQIKMKDLFLPININTDNIDRISEKFGFIDKLHNLSFVDWKNYDVAIFGISNFNTFESIDTVRSEFYKLYSVVNVKIIDLGNLIYDIDNDDSTYQLFDFFNVFIQHKIRVIFLCNNGLSNLIFYKYFVKNKVDFANLTVSNTVPFEDVNNGRYSEDNYLNFVNLNEKYNKRNCVLGAQKYLVSSSIASVFKNLKNKIYRLGEVQADLLYFEPDFRNSDIITIDYSSLKYFEAPGANKPQPNGFNAMEFCKLANFAGLSDNLTFFGIYGYNSINDLNTVGAKLIAQSIWHFLEAISRKLKIKDKKTDIATYYLNCIDNKQIKFQNCKKTDRWWLVVNNNNENKLLPCSYKDYNSAKASKLTKRISDYLKLYSQI